MRIGVVTAGGDAAGLNAAVRALGRRAITDGHELFGIRNGFAGLDGDLDAFRLDRDTLAGTLSAGGTILGTSRHDLDHPVGGRDRVAITAGNFDALVVIGGDGTQSVARHLTQRGVNVVGVPKTLDNDLRGTEYCIGFDSATAVVADALDRLHTTAASHHRVMVLETMGRESGWVATVGGLVGGSDLIVIPEFPTSIDHIVDHVVRRKSRGSSFSLITVAEGVDARPWGHEAPAGPGHALAELLAHRTGFETRCTVLGHLQRGGAPTAFDRLWATRVGSFAYELVTTSTFGVLASVNAGTLRAHPLDEIEGRRTVPDELFELAARFF